MLLGALVSQHVVLSVTGLLEYPHNMAAGLPQVEWSKREEGGGLRISSDLPQKPHAVLSTVSLLLSQVLSFQGGRKLHMGFNTW